MNKETKFRNKLTGLLKKSGFYTYHIRDVQNTGSRLVDIIACKAGLFYAFELKVMKRENEPSLKAVQSSLTKYQMSELQQLASVNANCFVVVYHYTSSDIAIDGINGKILTYKILNPSSNEAQDIVSSGIELQKVKTTLSRMKLKL